MNKSEVIGVRLIFLALLILLLTAGIFAGWMAALMGVIFLTVFFLLGLGGYYLFKDRL